MRWLTWEHGEGIGVLTKDMQRIVDKRDAGFAATVRADGTPEMAHPQLFVWDDDHLVFMEDMFSLGTVANLRHNPAIEVIVMDSVTRRAYRLTGRAEILSGGPLFRRIMAFFRNRYESHPALARVRRVGFITVRRAEPLVWPVYDAGASEDAAVSRYIEYHGHARRRVARGSAGSEGRHRS